jgi:hypothetical protein
MRKWITIMAASEILSATASMAAPPTPGPSLTAAASTTANPTSADPSPSGAGAMNRVNNNFPGGIDVMNRVNNKNADQPTR